MVTISRASLSNREEIEKLIAEYHASEGITPIKERIAWLWRFTRLRQNSDES